MIEKGYDEKYGARPLRRAVEHYLEDPARRGAASRRGQGARAHPRRPQRRQAGVQDQVARRRKRRVAVSSGSRLILKPAFTGGLFVLVVECRNLLAGDSECRLTTTRRIACKQAPT
ncbi:MAG: hypothetical protein WDM96_03805 [Lacunisphaera sp.]